MRVGSELRRTSNLPLAALLIAGDGQGHPVLGGAPVEFQLRRARAAGVEHAVVFVERATSALLASLDRLRREGLSVDIARSVGDTAELIHPEESVLLIAPNVLVAPGRLAGLTANDGPALLCVRDEPANERFELIDPTARWTGYAMIDGGLLRRTAAMVGDWDLGSTLLRRAVQEGAMRMTLTPDEAGDDLIILDGIATAHAAGRRLLAATPVQSAGWATHWIMAPSARVVARFAGEIGIEAKWVALAGFVFFALAVACAAAGWIAASLVLLLFGQLCDLSGDLGARAGAGAMPWEKWRYPIRAIAATVVVLGMGTTLFMRTLQWGCIVLAVVNVGATWMAAPLARENVAMTRWRSDPSGHAIIGLIGFIVGSPVGALAVAAAHAAISLGWAVRRGMTRLASS